MANGVHTNGDGQVDDPRALDERERDRRAVARQVAALSGSKQEESFRRELTRAVEGRRRNRSDLVQFEVVRDAEGRETAIVQGQILCRAEVKEHAKTWQMLKHQFSLAEDQEPEFIDCLDRRLVRWSSSDIEGPRLDDIARILRAKGFQASVNHVPPLGDAIIKGGTGPEPSALAAWPFVSSQASPGQVKVAVIDTGVTAGVRPDGWLAGIARIAQNPEPRKVNIDLLDALGADGGPDGFLDYGAGHGTFVSGVVAQLAPGADITAYRAIDSDGIGSEVDIACAMLLAVREKAQILNLSVGCPTLDDQPLLAIEVALELIDEMEGGRDVVIIAAAGNLGSTAPCWPAASRRILAVAGLTADMTASTWSSRGHWVDCSTIGEGILSTYVQGEEPTEIDPTPDRWVSEDAWAVWSGTSFAAPQIAGEIARRCLADPALTPRQALVALLASGRPWPDFGRAVRLLPGT